MNAKCFFLLLKSAGKILVAFVNIVPLTASKLGNTENVRNANPMT